VCRFPLTVSFRRWQLTLLAWIFEGRGIYYAELVPLWEGIDEWGHFARAQFVAEHGRSPGREELVSNGIVASLVDTPLSKAASELVPGSRWRGETGGALERGLPELKQYEAQQGPLYYWIAGGICRLMAGATIESRVRALRWLNLLLALGVVLTVFRLLVLALGSSAIATMAALVLATMPGFLMQSCRVANDALATLLASVALLLLWRFGEERRWILLGAVLGAALLTKAYTLALLPLLAVLAWNETGEARRRLFASLAMAALIAGWWYYGNLISTGTLSGEQLDAAAASQGLAGKVEAIRRMDWIHVLDAAAFTHIWVGGWSFLVARSWMYRVAELIAIAAIGGALWRLGRRREKGVALAWAFSLAFVLAMLYHSIAVFQTKGMSTALGWYMYAGIAGEILILGYGFLELFGRAHAVIALGTAVALNVAFELYTVFALLRPEYWGMHK
jgi:4-amino-4-deoxy-L-arabinose transferase-like glycosyltransferase